MKLTWKFLFFIGVIVLLPNVVEAQCSMCRAVLESEGDKSTAEGINNGIIFLMAFPYLLVGGLGYYIYKTYSSKSN